ncbi:hypothetical protein PAI11_43720 [Patulibacter medicamentivorans]|uniref:HTH cro/C1-type domain-containing protein n=1 Tax=Patulibacter medicamentivorans TaxID=1097667 RepID=H0EBY7_9ACTN|nr:helix-turn-helix transcriptional regulator [Patulibacter medicamentivorans]EHN08803.1 hypothetical protein PAI11_43720 [Patulibacter medicamentivorans]
MQARDVIVVARRRAGLTQARLAVALGVAVETLAAWESGADDPSYRQVQDVVALCGFDLHVGLPHADGVTPERVAAQLRLAPAARLAGLAVGPFDHREVLLAAAGSGARFVVIGEVAAALHGWPVPLAGHRVELVPHPADHDALLLALGQLEHVAHGPGRVDLLETPRGTTGHDDLAADARTIRLDGFDVAVASLVDLLRIDQAGDGHHVGVLIATLAGVRDEP